METAEQDRQPWSLRALSRQSGVPMSRLHRYLSAGLAPSTARGRDASAPPTPGTSLAIAAHEAERLCVALAAGVVSEPLCRMMREDPARLAEALDALRDVARAQVAERAAGSAQAVAAA